MRLCFLLLCVWTMACDDLWRGLARPHIELAWPSRSGTIALTQDDRRLVVVNPEHGSISIFDVDVPDSSTDPSARMPRRVAVLPTGDTPSAVVLHPNGDTAFVAHRGDHSIVQVSGLQSSQPQVAARIDVGAEPTALALSPLGRHLFVAESTEDSVAIIDTERLQIEHIEPGIASPRALLVTNNADGRDEDELLIVAEYLSTSSSSAASQSEHIGRLRLFRLRDYREAGTVALAPLSAASAGFGEVAWPNQLAGLALSDDGQLFVVGSAVSPQAPNQGPRAVNPSLFVIDPAQLAEVSGPLGSLSLAQRLQEKGRPDLWLAADPVAIDFVAKKRVGYVVARGAQVVLRVAPNQENSRLEIGSQKNDLIDLSAGPGPAATCEAPTGGVIGRRGLVNSQRMFINCWLSRTLLTVDFTQQRVESRVPLFDGEPLPAAVLRGKQAFFSARGRSAKQGWLSCASCHPDARSDGVTWVWAQGPRQTPSLDGLFSHGPGPQQQRVHGWTANADEVHDQEASLRSLLGGLGHLTQAMAPGSCGDLNLEQPLPIHAPLEQANRDVQTLGPSCTSTWDDIERFLRQLRPAPARRRLDPEAVSRGRLLFTQSGRCQSCHGGQGWSVSHLFYAPSLAQNQALAQRVPFARPPAWPASYSLHNSTQISEEPATAHGPALPPAQLACVLRNVGTYGAVDIEKDDRGLRSQGRAGYVVPSLYSLATSAPYLHHGQARSLDALLEDVSFSAHLRAGAENFSPTPSERADLVSFLLSLDEHSAEIAVPDGFASGCATQ